MEKVNHGIYIHIPFCRNKCDYCSFYSESIGNRQDFEDYLNSYVRRLIAEWRERAGVAGITCADTVYIGGGTPSLLMDDHVHDIIRAVKNSVSLDGQAEITLEMNPEDVSQAKIDGYRDAGINRIVLGMQTSIETLRQELGRSSGRSSSEYVSLFFSSRDIVKCIDIMTGIPGQDKKAFKKDIEIIARNKPHHISAYILTFEKDTPYSRRRKYSDDIESHQRKMYEKTISYITKLGYDHYEISNFCLPGYESRHNMKYWTFSPYIGLGPGAHSFIDGERSHNAMSVSEYLNSERTDPVRDQRTEYSAMVEYILTGLRLLKGLSMDVMETRLEKKIPQPVMESIKREEQKGMIVIESAGDRVFKLSPGGLFFADSVIYNIVESLL